MQGTPASFRIFLDATDTIVANRPKAGDFFSVNFSTMVVRNGTDTVIAPRQFISQPDKVQATNDGVLFSVRPPEMIQSYRRDGRTDNLTISFSVGRADSIKNNTYRLMTTGFGSNASGIPFLSILVTRMSDTVNVKKVDTVYSLSSINFNGIAAVVEFQASSIPQAGNEYYVTTVIPVEPTLSDRYRFTINGATIDQQKIKPGLSNIKVVPNPYIVSSIFEPEYGELRREPVRQIQFTNLPPECTIHIFTVDANLVKTIRHNSGNGTEPWDLKSEGGREVASGVYMYLLKTDSGEYMNRFAVIK